MATLKSTPISELLPHDHPMILIDRVVENGNDFVCCEVQIRQDSPFAIDTGVPAYVGLEYMAQTIAAYGGVRSLLKGEPVKIGFLLGGPAFTTSISAFSLGETFHITAKNIWGDHQMMQFQCDIVNVRKQTCVQSANINTFTPENIDQMIKGAKS